MRDVTLLSLLRHPLLDPPVNIFPLKCSEILAETPFFELTLVLALAMHASNYALILLVSWCDTLGTHLLLKLYLVIMCALILLSDESFRSVP